MLVNLFGGFASWGPDFLRLGVAATVIAHGYPKVFGEARKGLAGYLSSLSIQPANLWSWVVTISEFFGGICLILGLFTRLVALVLAIEFLVIIVKVKWSKGFMMEKGGWEWEFALFMMLLSLLVTGPGRAALDNRIHTGL